MSETTTRKIRLDVQSPVPALAGIEATIKGLKSAQGAIERVNAEADILRANLSTLGASPFARNLAAQVTQSVSGLHQITQAAQQAQAAVASIAAASRGIAVPTPRAAAPAGGGTSSVSGRWLNIGFSSWTPGGFAQNMVTAAGWRAATAGPEAVMRLAQHSYQRAQELSLQTARLTQIFRGVGGSASELTDDVLKLAVAEGQGADAAMKAAVAWSRLGLTRRQVLEGTRVSLMAANVSTLGPEESANALASISTAYRMQPSELSPVLGMLVSTANRYRVTPKDLLEGVSRVSGVASAAGLPLAQLQAIIGTATASSGMPGSQIGIALKTVFSRLQRPDIQDYLGNRFGLRTTGSATDLRDLWSAYSKLNAEEGREMVSKVGAATQSNRLLQILRQYPEAMRQALVSQTALTTAESEDLNVTNSLLAAKQRLASAWDRFAVSPQSPVGNFVTGSIRGGMDWLSGDLAAVSNLFSGPGTPGQKWYHSPDNASLWSIAAHVPALGAQAWSAIASPVAAFANRISPMSPAQAARWRYSYLNPSFLAESWGVAQRELGGYSVSPESNKDLFQQFADRVNTLKFKGAAAGQKSDWLKTLGGAWGTMSPERQAEILGSLGGVLSRSGISALQAGGNGREIFGAEAESASKRQADYAKAAQRLNETEISRLSGKGNLSPEEQAQLNELMGKRLGLAEEIVKETEDYEAHEARIVPVLERQKALLTDIGNTAKALGASKYVDQILTLQTQLAAVGGMMRTPNMDDEVLATLRKSEREMRARLAYATSPTGAYFAGFERNSGIVSSMTGAEVDASGVGRSHGEQLLARRDWLNAQIRGLGDVSKIQNTDSMVRAQTLLNAAKQTELQLSERLVRLEGERKNLLLESQREFQKSLITSGPGDILRKLATVSLMSRGALNAGSFFAMAPEARGDAYNLMGGSQMAELNAEGRTLRGRTLSTPGLQDRFAQLDSESLKITAVFGEALASASTRLSTFEIALAAATTAITGFANAARFAPGSGSDTPTAPTSRPPAQALPQVTVEPPGLPGMRHYSDFN